MTTKRITSAAAALLVATGVVGCTNEATVEEDDSELEIYTYWNNEETNDHDDNLKIVTEEFTRQYPDVLVRNGALSWSAMEAQDYAGTITSRIAEDRAPDIFQMSAKQFIGQWVTDGNISSLADASFFQDDRFVMTTKQLGEDGVAYGVPMNAIRDNMIFLNLHVFRAAGVTQEEIDLLKGPEATFDDLFAVADKIAAGYAIAKETSGFEGTPFALYQSVADPASDVPGSRYPWTFKDVFLDCIMPGTLGVDEWRKLTSEPKAEMWEQPKMREALTNLKRYVDRSNQDFMTQCQDCAPWHSILEGKTAMVALGDWYVATFRALNLKYGEDWDAIPCPGSQGAFVGHSDMFMVPPNAPRRINALRFLEVASSEKVQVAFNARFGSLPAVKVDVSQLSDDKGFDGYSRANHADISRTGFVWRTEAATHPAISYIAALGPFGERVLGLDMVTDAAAVDAAIDDVVLSLKTNCVDGDVCK